MVVGANGNLPYLLETLYSKERIRNIRKLGDKAKEAFALRNEYRTATRQYMKDRNWADHLEQVEKNMTWEEIIKNTQNKKYINSLEDAYEEIIRTSTKGRETVNDLFKIKD